MDAETLASQRSEESEVLQSIYGGDEAFHMLDPSTYQLRIESPTAPAKRLLVQIHWPAPYPDQLPEITLDIFYNNHLSHVTKERIRGRLLQEADGLLGSPMTYSVFEFVRENIDSLIVDEDLQACRQQEKEKVEEKVEMEFVKAVEDKDHARGWNWVDVVKHLSQTGGQTV